MKGFVLVSIVLNEILLLGKGDLLRDGRGIISIDRGFTAPRELGGLRLLDCCRLWPATEQMILFWTWYFSPVQRQSIAPEKSSAEGSLVVARSKSWMELCICELFLL